MNPITLDVLLAGLAATIAGLTLQMIGRAAFSRFKSDDTKEIAGVVGLRVSAIFGIAVGLIFASTTAHLMSVKKDVQEEARLVATLYFLMEDAPDIAKSGVVRDNLRQYLKLSQSEYEDPDDGEQFARETSHILVKVCRRMALNDQESVEARWTKEEFQRSCSKLIDIRGKKRVGTMENRVSAPFWIFFGISFGFLAVLFGVFDRSIINIVFASLFYFATGVTGMLIYAAADPYHNPGKVSAAPLTLLKERIKAEGDAEAPRAPGDTGDHGAPKTGAPKSGTVK